jgi:hypothetical protein
VLHELLFAESINRDKVAERSEPPGAGK